MLHLDMQTENTLPTHLFRTPILLRERRITATKYNQVKLSSSHRQNQESQGP